MQASKAGEKQRSRNRGCWSQKRGAESTKDISRRPHMCGFLLLHNGHFLVPLQSTRSFDQGRGKKGVGKEEFRKAQVGVRSSLQCSKHWP